MTTLGWLMILGVLVLGAAIAYGLLRSRTTARSPEHRRASDEATRRLYDKAAETSPPD
jgi:cytochrome c-type biogenesis protein CcmH/NrfF